MGCTDLHAFFFRCGNNCIGLTDRLNHPYIEAEDLGLALVKFKNGAYGIIEGTTDRKYSCKIHG